MFTRSADAKKGAGLFVFGNTTPVAKFDGLYLLPPFKSTELPEPAGVAPVALTVIEDDIPRPAPGTAPTNCTKPIKICFFHGTGKKTGYDYVWLALDRKPWPNNKAGLATMLVRDPANAGVSTIYLGGVPVATAKRMLLSYDAFKFKFDQAPDDPPEPEQPDPPKEPKDWPPLPEPPAPPFPCPSYGCPPTAICLTQACLGYRANKDPKVKQNVWLWQFNKAPKSPLG